MDDPARRPKFNAVVISVDTPLKDKETSDNVSIQAWGIKGADRYLLDIQTARMNYGKAKRSIIEMSNHVRKMFPRSAHYVLIENAGYGVELIVDLKREITGVQKVSAGQEGDKETRAESASDALESGNCFLPGYREGGDELSMPDSSRNSADVTAFIESCAIFPNGAHDDDVDAWSQCMNWLRGRPMRRGRTFSAFGGQRAAA